MRVLLSLIILFVLAYAAFTGYVGFRVARGIDDVKASSVTTRVGMRLMGREAVERLAIHKGNVPSWVTNSPAFWAALRASE